jgi:molybdate transport system regulatory protein
MHETSKRARLPARVRSKVWIERDDEVVLSEWRVELLEAIETHGSLRRAADALSVPYRTAWDRVKATESELGMQLVASESGGADGGGSRLTAEGRDVCRRFRRVAAGIQDTVDRRFAAEFAEMTT